MGDREVLDRTVEPLPGDGNSVWPQAITQTCIVHLLRNSFTSVTRSDQWRIALMSWCPETFAGR